MIHSKLALAVALRRTADRLEAGARYQWTHMGSCNCGHLAQTLTKLAPEEIHARALEKAGDWSEQALEYCAASRYPIDLIIETMLEAGLTRADLFHLERLSSPLVLAQLPEGERYLDHRRREDAIRYMRVWADLVEATSREAKAAA